MRWINITILTILTILMALTATTTADTLRQDSTHTVCRLTTAEAAIARALAYTGFDKLESYSRSVQVVAEQMSVGETDPEVLRAEFDGKQLWRVDFDNVTFDSSGGCARDFEVYLDAEQGRLVHIWSCCQSNGCDTVRNAASAWRSPDVQLESNNPLLKYDGIVPEPPVFSFLDVLREWLPVSNFSQARLITGILILRSGRGVSEQPTWLIMLSGMQGEPPNRRSRTSHVGIPSCALILVDAKTGAMLRLEKTGPPSIR
jgi:hypothetical protein